MANPEINAKRKIKAGALVPPKLGAAPMPGLTEMKQPDACVGLRVLGSPIVDAHRAVRIAPPAGVRTLYLGRIRGFGTTI